MIHRIEYLKDTLGSNYLGVNISQQMVQPYLDRLKDHLGDEYDTYIKLQQQRDHGKYHITLMSVMEYNQVSEKMGADKFINSLENVFDYEFDDIKFLGLGTAQKADNKAFFVVVKSEKLEQVRKAYNLDPKDFHITIGFKWKDVHGVRKNNILQESDPFIKLLAKQYYNHGETFDFIKEIENYEWPEDEEIMPIQLNDTTATFKVMTNDYFTVAIVNNKFRVVANWQDTNKKPTLPDTVIAKKFKF